MTAPGLVKVVVRLAPDPEQQTEHSWAEAETLWAQPVGDDLFEIRNIPWETDALHFLDVVRGQPLDEGSWGLLELVRPSDAQRGELISSLEQLVGRAEHMTDNHWAVDVNPDTNLAAALDLLHERERDGVITSSAHT